MPTTLCPSETMSASPCAAPSVPRVATKGGMPSDATSQPLVRPKARPTHSAPASPSISDWVATTISASTSEARVSTAPMERSSPSVMMMSVMGKARSSRITDCTRMLERLPAVRKLGLDTANSTLRPTSATATPGTDGMRARAEPGAEERARSLIVHPHSDDVLFG